DDRADPTFGEFALPIDSRLGERAVFIIEPSGNAGAENPVLHLEVVELQRREDHVRTADMAHASPASWKLRRHTVNKSLVTKLLAGQAFQGPCMNTGSGPGACVPAAASWNSRRLPGRNSSPTRGVANDASTVRGTCRGGARH